MHARKFAVSLFSLALGLTFASFAGAAADVPAADTPNAPQAVEKSCCKHHDSADGKAGMHCDHAKMKGEGEKGEDCCAQHAAMHKEGAAGDAKACCAKHAEMKKQGADTKACCAEHAANMKDGDKAGCCCCASGAACPHAAAQAAPAKS